jgi:hypothetical protein
VLECSGLLFAGVYGMELSLRGTSCIILCAVSFLFAKFLAKGNSNNGIDIYQFHVVCCKHFTLTNNLPCL